MIADVGRVVSWRQEIHSRELRRHLLERFAIIPARGGSKRIPRKNLREFHGKPIIQWVLETLREVQIFDRIIVSTEDQEISSLVKELGFEVPFQRPNELSDDFSTTSDVATHAIEWLVAEGAAAEARFLTMYPTAALATADHIIRAEHLLDTDGSNFVFVGAKFPSQTSRAWRKTSLGFLEALQPELQASRTQDFDEDFYYDLGQFYWSTATSWQGTKQNPQLRKMLEVSPLEVVDIDTEDDWKIAEKLFLLSRK